MKTWHDSLRVRRNVESAFLHCTKCFAGTSVVKFVYKSREDEDEANSDVYAV